MSVECKWEMQEEERCRLDVLVVCYLDELSCVCDGGFLCDLLLDGLGLAGACWG